MGLVVPMSIFNSNRLTDLPNLLLANTSHWCLMLLSNFDQNFLGHTPHFSFYWSYFSSTFKKVMMLFGSLCDIRSLDMYRYLTHPSKKLSRGSVESRRYSGSIHKLSNRIMYTFLCGCIYEGTLPTRPDFSFSASTYGRGFGFSFFVIPPSSFYPYGLLH